MIPFSIPANFASGIADGSLIRFGAIIKDAGSGSIVAHLQETGVSQQLLSNTVSLPFSPISAASSLGANVQLAALTNMMAVMQMLQFATLGATLIGVGVSVAGFKAMSTRFDQVQSQISSLSDNVNQHFQELKARDYRSHQSRVKSLLEQADLAYSYSNSTSEWIRISHALADEAGFYQGEIQYLLSLDVFDEQLFQTFTQLYTICNSARIKCLMLADELLAARDISKATSNQYNFLFDPLTPITLAKQSINLIHKTDQPYEHLLRQELMNTKQLVSSMREVQDTAATRPLLLDTLIERNISGQAFFERLESEKIEPILCLDTTL